MKADSFLSVLNLKSKTSRFCEEHKCKLVTARPDFPETREVWLNLATTKILDAEIEQIRFHSIPYRHAYPKLDLLWVYHGDKLKLETEIV